jgi:hypothetical protein
MEILRFDEPDAPTPKRKRPSKAWLALSLVAALMGVGTAFASSTINLNRIDLGQGVTSIVSCDDKIGIVPKTGLSFVDDSGHFELKSIVIGSPDTSLSTAGTVSDDCAGKIFKVTLYDEDHHSVGSHAEEGYATTLCDYFRNGTDTVDTAVSSECVDDPGTGTSSIYFIASDADAPTPSSKTYTVHFYKYDLSVHEHKLKIDPSNITVETVSDYPDLS